MYLGIAIEYEYGDDNTGTFGFIGKYDPERNDIDILESWGN